MYPAAPISSSADATTVTASSQQFPTLTMLVDGVYMYTCNVGSWICQGANPTASAAAGSMYVPPLTPMFLSGNNGSKLATIRDGASSGTASLVPVQL